VTAYKRLTIDDIASLAGVSRTTASMVLNGHAERYRISPATVARVEKVAREHHFNPSQSARSLRSKRSNSIGLVIPDLTNSAHATLAQAMENLCRERDYQLVLVTSDEDPQREAEGMAHLVARQVDGMAVVPCSSDAALYQQWTSRLPLVFVDRRIDGSGIPSVVTDATDTVARLIGSKLAQGMQEVVYFGGQPTFHRVATAWRGIGKPCSNMASPPCEWIVERDFQRASGFAMMQQWHAREGRYPQALFTASITLLEGVLSFMSQTHHLREAPSCLMTFDDHPCLTACPSRSTPLCRMASVWRSSACSRFSPCCTVRSQALLIWPFLQGSPSVSSGSLRHCPVCGLACCFFAQVSICHEASGC
jgi:LacI family sucrose operon transcriptional repressor